MSQGFTNQSSFNFFFEWFYEDHFKIIEVIFQNFSEDTTVLKAMFQLMIELLNNSSGRLKSDSCYLNGFLLFKEISGIMMQYFKYVNLYEAKKIHGDIYENKYQFIEMAVEIYANLVAGNFINFSV